MKNIQELVKLTVISLSKKQNRNPCSIKWSIKTNIRKCLVIKKLSDNRASLARMVPTTIMTSSTPKKQTVKFLATQRKQNEYKAFPPCEKIESVTVVLFSKLYVKNFAFYWRNSLFWMAQVSPQWKSRGQKDRAGSYSVACSCCCLMS